MADLNKLQKIIGYRFQNRELLKQALTHSSYANEKGTGHLGSNERLEYLGDAVLELVSSEYFYHAYPEVPEGKLTKMRASFVCEPALAETSERISLKDFILLGKGEEATGGRKRPSIISDAFEALIGAVYLDGGFANAKELILRFILADTDRDEFFYDSKTILQEEMRKRLAPEPTYVLLDESGPDHEKVFVVEVRSGEDVLGRGTDSSKKHAEQRAAYEALKTIGRV